MARDDLQFRLRIPEALKAQIEKSAAENNRSMTAEIISRLERSYEIDPNISEMQGGIDELFRMMEKLEGRIDAIEFSTGIADNYNDRD
ncbi:Arc family DNA-binding protein [Brucella anthropi]|uniref:Arc family DNA-binding protein n=1 Tax=Brucella anthropi TaxID=529 RepID=UPI00124EC569|nr:Arc family DNA-binding protein [Brucella anthropi]KAB2762763.1 Arc family DNA-binding protein [Brucella anthropi]